MTTTRYTPQQEEIELNKMTDTEAKAYYRICLMSTKFMMSTADKKQNARHLKTMVKIISKRKLELR